MFFEAAREQAEAECGSNPRDVQARAACALLSHHSRASPQALTRWGGALLELAHFRTGPDAVEYIKLARRGGTFVFSRLRLSRTASRAVRRRHPQAVDKFESALKIEPRKHEANWCLGNALTSQGFLFAEDAVAKSYFTRARACFEKALREEPDNETYRKAVEMTSRAPALHAELQRQFAAQQLAEDSAGGGSGGGGRGGGRGGGKGAAAAPKDDESGWVYDIAGWVILGAIAAGWVVLAGKA